jgi:glyoxylase-like metal-dependent hydrolase (beta-lactamase superfamily II)
MNRRRLSFAATIAVLLTGTITLAQNLPYKPSDLGMHRVALDVYVYTFADPKSTDPKQTTNSLIVVTPEGVLVGDGQGTDAATQDMINEIHKITNQPIKYLINASPHGDHTTGNHLFKGATIIAQTAARDDMLASYKTANANMVPAPPTVTYDRNMSIFLGGKEIRLGFYGRAHTRGDSAIYLPADRVVFLSEIFFNPKQLLGLRTGYPTEWIATVNSVSKLDADIWIPGHGILENQGHMHAQLLQMRDQLVDMRNEIKGYVDRGLTLEQTHAMSPLKKYADLIRAEILLQPAIDRIYKDLKGELDASLN